MAQEVPVASCILRTVTALILFQSHEKFVSLSETITISRFIGIHENYGMIHLSFILMYPIKPQ